MKVVVLAPVLLRPRRVWPLYESLRDSVASGEAGIVFLVSPSDHEEIAAVDALRSTQREDGLVSSFVHAVVVPWDPASGDYARKINHGAAWARELGAEWVLLGADDLAFHPGWLDAALAVHVETDACVIGTNDLGNHQVTAGLHSTHPLVHLDYLDCGTIDEPGKLLHEGYHHNFCNPPEAPIWMADLDFKPIGTVRVGDKVMGWEYSTRGGVGAPKRSLCHSEVLDVQQRLAPLVRVTMESGRSFRCTPDHRWLNALWYPSSKSDGSRGGGQWVTPKSGRSLLHVIDPPRPRLEGFEREYGWLAGIYDGEGSGIYVATQSLKNPAVIAEIGRCLRAVGIPHKQTERKSGIVDFVLSGGRQGYLDYLLAVRPVRRDSLAACIVGHRWRNRGQDRGPRSALGARRFGHVDRIATVEETTGQSIVISLKTSTGNYVAWGYASRNCDTEFVGTAKARGTWAFAADSRVEHLHHLWGKAANDAVYEAGSRMYASDQLLHNHRSYLWENR